jgi:hypothetical protein
MTHVVRTKSSDETVDIALPRAIEALEVMIADPGADPAMRAKLERAVAKYRSRVPERS